MGRPVRADSSDARRLPGSSLRAPTRPPAAQERPPSSPRLRALRSARRARPTRRRPRALERRTGTPSLAAVGWAGCTPAALAHRDAPLQRRRTLPDLGSLLHAASSRLVRCAAPQLCTATTTPRPGCRACPSSRVLPERPWCGPARCPSARRTYNALLHAPARGGGVSARRAGMGRPLCWHSPGFQNGLPTPGPSPAGFPLTRRGLGQFCLRCHAPAPGTALLIC
jgi:hypothetical protein